MSPLLKEDVLVVDDDDAIRTFLRIAIIRAGMTCGTARDGIDALEQMGRTHFRVVLTDLMMPRLDGIGFVKELAALDDVSQERPVILMMTAFHGNERLTEVAGIVHAIVRKPFDSPELIQMVRGCIETRAEIEKRASEP